MKVDGSGVVCCVGLMGPELGLSRRTTTEGLREAFSKFGEVVHAKVVTDRVSGYSKGYGFVRYATTEEASKGIKGMDGQGANEWHPSNVSRKEICKMV
ncbi:Organelle RRM domain-containing protein 2 mitochondrial [Bienertia sinuspersici]